MGPIGDSRDIARLYTPLRACAGLARGFAGAYRPGMLRPSRPAAILALALTACPAERDPGGEGTSTGSTGAEPSTGEAATSTGGESSSGNASTGEGSTSSSGSSSTADGSSSTTEPAAVCGDAVVGGDEQCDDGKATVLCDDNCTLAQCGDGYVNEAAGEQCDDGNATISPVRLGSASSFSLGTRQT